MGIAFFFVQRGRVHVLTGSRPQVHDIGFCYVSKGRSKQALSGSAEPDQNNLFTEQVERSKHRK